LSYLLDTHTWLWLVEASDRLPPRARSILQDVANAPLGISAISPWEIAKKSSLAKLSLSLPCREWILQSSRNPGVRLLPLSPEIAYEAIHLPGEFHRDPADQIIVATARLQNLTVITCDRRILAYAHVRTVWE
jgi:PIN domain nuclease of toxin-antitoxin system